MIKANELRIGNWINDAFPYDFVFQVNPDHIARAAEGIKIYRPIPMTPEILSKCHGTGPWWQWLLLEKPTTVKIEYLHQLQNLYFALTGEELLYTQ